MPSPTPAPLPAEAAAVVASSNVVIVLSASSVHSSPAVSWLPSVLLPRLLPLPLPLPLRLWLHRSAAKSLKSPAGPAAAVPLRLADRVGSASD